MISSLDNDAENTVIQTAPVRAKAEPTKQTHFAGLGIGITTRRWQALPLNMDQANMIYAVESGVLALEITPPDGAPALLSIAMPGDVLSALAAPTALQARIFALQAGAVRRIRDVPMQGAHAVDTAEALAVQERKLRSGIIRHEAASLLHAAVISHLSGGERIASILLSLALRLGQTNDRGSITFEMPLTRTQLGNYAALNADTVSRVMSRMEQRLELIRPRRQTFHIPSLDSIAAQTPYAAAITALHGTTPSQISERHVHGI